MTGTARRTMIACFVVMVVGSASRGEASCGDYLLHGERHPADMTGLVDRPDLPASWPQSPPSPHRPTCSGPGCQKTPYLPLNNRTVPIRFPDDDRGCVVALFELTGRHDGKTPWMVESLLTMTSLYRDRLERPPMCA